MSLKTLIGLASVLLVSCSTSPWSVSRRNPASLGELQTRFLDLSYGSQSLHLRIGIQEPAKTPIADILYLHGFGDRLDNHGPLFDEWAQAGFRVISFDLPSHGENSGSYNNLNHFSFSDLGKLLLRVEKETLPEDPHRPLFLSGWSTGGLILVRMIQTGQYRELSRAPAGVILFAPGVSVKKFPWTFGNGWGEITDESLTHDPHPPHQGHIRPDTPFWNDLVYGFSPKLVANCVLSQMEPYPESLNTLVFVAGDWEDRYAKSKSLKEWIQEQNEKRREKGTSTMIGIQCPHSRHELDNELPEYGGIEVRELSAAFVLDLVQGKSVAEISGSICKRFSD